MDERMTVKVLRRAAELVDQGWTQGCYGVLADGTKITQPLPDDLAAATQLCVMGAMFRAADELGLNTGYAAEAAAAITARTIPAMAYQWQDAPGRTGDEVAGLCRDTADALEATHA